MSSLVTPAIEQLRPYQGGKPIEELARERGLTDIIKLASNENPLGASPLAVEAARNALSRVSQYPDGSGFRLRSAIAEYHGVSRQEVIHGNGSNELIELILRTFTTSSHHVVFGQPAFSMYPVVASAHGVEFTRVPTDDDFVHDLEGMRRALRPETRIVIIDNPNNPTGTYVSREHLERFLQAIPREVIVILDEAYFEYADAEDFPDGLKLRHLHPRLMILRTFSKAFGLAGFRVGYGIGPASLIEYLDRLRAPFNVGVPSQEAAIAALQDTEHLEKSVSLNRRERARVSARLAELVPRVFPSQANFILVDCGRPQGELYEKLLDRGVIVRPIPGLATFLRITVGTERENDRFLQAFTEVLQ